MIRLGELVRAEPRGTRPGDDKLQTKDAMSQVNDLPAKIPYSLIGFIADMITTKYAASRNIVGRLGTFRINDLIESIVVIQSVTVIDLIILPAINRGYDQGGDAAAPGRQRVHPGGIPKEPAHVQHFQQTSQVA